METSKLEFLEYLKKNYKAFLLEKVEKCYVKEIDKSLDEIIEKIEIEFKK